MTTTTTDTDVPHESWKRWVGLVGSAVAILTVGRKLLKGTRVTPKEWLAGAVAAATLYAAFNAE